MKISVPQNNIEVIVEQLKKVLADTFILSLKTRHYHWNVTGPHFQSFHLLFDEIYDKLDEIGDSVAERIRALGKFPQGNYQTFIKDTRIKEETELLKEMEIVERLVYDMEILIERCNDAKEAALKGEDDVTADLMIEHLRQLETFRWMLNSHLGPK